MVRPGGDMTTWHTSTLIQMSLKLILTCFITQWRGRLWAVGTWKPERYLHIYEG